MSKKIVINSGTGLIGRYFLKAILEKGYQAIILTRNIQKAKETLSAYPNLLIEEFNPIIQNNNITNVIDHSYAVVNFSGATISKRKWTDEYKKILYTSRGEVTKVLVSQMKKCENKPRVFINMSAVGYYGYDKEKVATDNSLPGSGFISELCIDWENAALESEDYGIRAVVLRSGIVLTDKGGALERILTPFKFFVGGILGSGKQWMPWIHIEDLVNLILFCMENESIRGAINATSPQQITNREFTKILARLLKRPIIFKVPSAILKLILGDFAVNVLEGIQVIPEKSLAAGFKFKYDKLEEALRNLLFK